ADVLRKKLDAAPPAQAKKWHLKLGVACFFLGHTFEASEHLRQAEGALANFTLGRALVSLNHLDDALKAFEKAEKTGYNASQVQLQRVGIHRQQGHLDKAREILKKLEEQMAPHSAEFHFQLASCFLAEGDRASAVKSLERAIELDPTHTPALFQLGHANDLAGNDDEAISYYERCLKYPPLHVGTLKNLGILYEDHEQYDKAAECFSRVLTARPTDEQARLYLKDAVASRNMYYNPEEDEQQSRF